MPTFRTTPSANLAGSIRRLVASGGGALSPLQAAQADSMAASTARNMSLAEKARAEVEAMNRSQADRSNPAVATEYAGNAAGIDQPDATRLYKAISGARERPPIEMDEEGNRMPDVTFAKPENLPAGSERVFRSALASTIANRLATGKTNAAQLAQSGDRINETALTNEAANTADVPTANRIVAAVAGRVREPFKLGAQGQVLNEETGNVNEGTRLAGASRDLITARTGTEGYRQTELAARAGRNVAQTGLATARSGAVERGETNKGGARVTPQQVERWVSDVARKEWDTIPARDRKGMNYEQHLSKVRERFTGKDGSGGIEGDSKDALDAINRGAPSKAVHARFEKRWGKKLIDVVPDASDSGLGAGDNALDEED